MKKITLDQAYTDFNNDTAKILMKEHQSNFQNEVDSLYRKIFTKHGVKFNNLDELSRRVSMAKVPNGDTNLLIDGKAVLVMKEAEFTCDISDCGNLTTIHAEMIYKEIAPTE